MRWISTPSSPATVFFVSPSGSDSNGGTSTSSPWQTIGKVNSASLASGNTVLFQGGQSFSGSLTVQAGVTYGVYGGGTATISSGSSDGAVATNVGGWTLNGLTFTGNGTTTNSAYGIHAHNTQTGGIKYNNITVTSCVVSQYGNSGILFIGDNDTCGFNNVTISNSTVHDCTGKAVIPTGSEAGASAGILFSGVDVSGVGNYNHTNITITNCVVHDCIGISNAAGGFDTSGNGILMQSTNGGTIEFCEVFTCGSANDNTSGPAGIWSALSNNVTIQFCEAYNMQTGSDDADGFDFDGGMTNSVMQYNYSHDNQGTGILAFEFSASGIWNNNTFRYNICQNNGISVGASGEFRYGGSITLPHLKFYNNTLYNVNSGKTLIRGQTSLSNGQVSNNILFASANYFNLDSGTTAPSFTGNDYTGGASFLYLGTTYTSLSSWQSATGQEEISSVNVGLTVNPAFNNGGNGGTVHGYAPQNLAQYQYNKNSPVIDAGVNLVSQYGFPVGSQDFYGNPIPDANGKYGVGAFEFTPGAFFNWVQGGNHQNGGSSVTTVALTLPAKVGVGDFLCISVSFAGSVSTDNVTMSDDKGNTYPAAVDQIVNTTVPGGYALYTFYILNVTNQPQTITATNNSNARTFMTISIDEFSVSTSVSGLDGHSAQQQNGATGVDGVSSGTYTTTGNGDLVWGTLVSTGSNGMLVGTGFQAGSQNDLIATFTTEYQIQAAASSSTAITGTLGSTDHTVAGSLAFSHT